MIRKPFAPKTIQQKIRKPHIHRRERLRGKSLKIGRIERRNKINTIGDAKKRRQNPVEIEDENNYS